MPNITTNHAIICLYYYPQKVCNCHMQVFQIKLNDTTALSQTNCRNFSCGSIKTEITISRINYPSKIKL